MSAIEAEGDPRDGRRCGALVALTPSVGKYAIRPDALSSVDLRWVKRFAAPA
jgi:hypothetical protein